MARARKSSRMAQVLKEFEDLQRTQGIRYNGKKYCMSSVLDAGGKEQTRARDIAEVFAAFLESLYNGNSDVFRCDATCDRAAAVAPEE
eukprot:8596355-Pyramimonas_sp.AAC.1